MVSAKLLQIFAVGPTQDKKLYGNPQITFFKTVYQRHTNFGSNSICKDINNTNAGFGNIVRFKVQREGDLLAGIYIRAELSITRVNQFSDNFNLLLLRLCATILNTPIVCKRNRCYLY